MVRANPKEQITSVPTDGEERSRNVGETLDDNPLPFALFARLNFLPSSELLSLSIAPDSFASTRYMRYSILFDAESQDLSEKAEFLSTQECESEREERAAFQAGDKYKDISDNECEAVDDDRQEAPTEDAEVADVESGHGEDDDVATRQEIRSGRAKRKAEPDATERPSRSYSEGKELCILQIQPRSSKRVRKKRKDD